ncbi:MAG: MBL fold metallo-hydrolase [Acidobacteria bacterium]|nr:MBL fold metallo-hydrolase [Acidobacteriota bacterium]
MRVTFLGTGTSHGVPVIGCRCETCRSNDPRDRRWRPSITLELADGTSILVDTSPDLRAQALRFNLARVDVILLTHSHADHILGLDDVRAYNLLQGGGIPCCGDARTLADIRRTFAYAFDPGTPFAGGVPRLLLRELMGPFCLSDCAVTPVPLLHGTRPILGFRFNRFAYLTDCNAIPESSWPLLDDVEVVVLDCLRNRPHPTHFTVEQAVEVARRIGARHTYFTHMTHDLPHAATCARLPRTMELAYDGLVLDLSG